MPPLTGAWRRDCSVPAPPDKPWQLLGVGVLRRWPPAKPSALSGFEVLPAEFHFLRSLIRAGNLTPGFVNCARTNSDVPRSTRGLPVQFTKAIQLALCPQTGEALSRSNWNFDIDRTTRVCGLPFQCGRPVLRTLVSRACEPPSVQTWRCKIAATRASTAAITRVILRVGLAHRSLRADSTRRLNHKIGSARTLPIPQIVKMLLKKSPPERGAARIPGAILKTAS
jgi:hypothetical protein